ncbi:MAG: membrane protein insertase YidC [Candidatus Omnitrophota bacterium]|nr:membrane protein insertase YidC [Candidatus Omnitrophota bacterium]
MEKRTLLAIVLSVVVLFIYSTFASRMYPVANKEDTSKKTALVLLEKPVTPSADIALPQESTVDEYFQWETDKMKIFFANPGARISRVELKEHNTSFFLEDLLVFNDEKTSDFKVERTKDAIIFTFRDTDQEIIKRYSLHNNSYYIELEHTIRRFNTSAPSACRVWLNSKLIKQTDQDNRFMELAIAQPKNIVRKALLGLKPSTFQSDKVDWVGLRDRYFAFILRPESKIEKIITQQNNEQVLVEVVLESKEVDKFTLYLGPQDIRYLNAANLGFENILYFGFFDTISQVLLSVLKFLFGVTHNWGGAILLFGFLIFISMYPLTLKQMRSMKEMQILQPKIKELQERYKGDSQRLNKEIMQLYRDHKVNPLGGCLPMLLQMPIFFALYQALMRFVGLRGAKFLWIKDLSQPDRFIMLPNKLPIIGSEINILPILMMVSMFMQQKVSMGAMSGGSSAEQQKLMLILMPLLFGFLFYSMPAALVLYWFVYGVLSGAQQWLLMRRRQAE